MGFTSKDVVTLPEVKLPAAFWNAVMVYVPTPTSALIVTLLPSKVSEGLLGDTAYEKAPPELDVGGVIWKEKGIRL